MVDVWGFVCVGCSVGFWASEKVAITSRSPNKLTRGIETLSRRLSMVCTNYRERGGKHSVAEAHLSLHPFRKATDPRNPQNLRARQFKIVTYGLQGEILLLIIQASYEFHAPRPRSLCQGWPCRSAPALVPSLHSLGVEATEIGLAHQEAEFGV